MLAVKQEQKLQKGFFHTRNENYMLYNQQKSETEKHLCVASHDKVLDEFYFHVYPYNNIFQG